MPTVTVPLRSAVSSPTLSAASSTAPQAARRMLREGAPRVGWHHTASGADE